MDFAILVQARCGSTRLPYKILMDLYGKPAVIRVIDRLDRCKLIDDVFVITTISSNNLPLIKLCAENKIRLFIGSEEDVLDRYYQCAKLINTKYIIRITADCPLIDWRYIDEGIKAVKNDPDIDYFTDYGHTFPDGLDFEIVKFSALERVWNDAKLSSEREHVTMYIRNNPTLFNIGNLSCPISNISHHRWVLDEYEDYELLNTIYEHFLSKDKEDFVTEDIIDFLNKNPRLVKLNSKYGRNEGLTKSQENDKIVK